MVTWTCHICGEERPDSKVSVCSTDLSEEHKLPKGTMVQNVRYCNDRKNCCTQVRNFRFIKNN